MRLLDLCCGAGGASMGYHLAGWEVVGVDNVPQPDYPFEFHTADALDYLAQEGASFDAVHISPPCQRFSRMSRCRPGLAMGYPDFIGPARRALRALGLPFAIENVVGAEVRPDLTLCGMMFGLLLYRHRVFELSFPCPRPLHPPHRVPIAPIGHWKPGRIIQVAGHVHPIEEARKAMGIDWMKRNELAEAIPPAFTRYIGTEMARSVSGT